LVRRQRLDRVEAKIDEIGKLLGRIARALLLPKPSDHGPALVISSSVDEVAS
jgi:hypothetical protein